ncbi:C-type natriuretic peptide prohormone-like [Ammospiza nelsoni]|uniref:C-type natriuretic peptide prohormone-like n=1 Tax=Ammospiza caudacuta TaxID=2857398 RepID=UPI00273A37DA|nr:C-type natriuretic peptide prohormone-like [Ammospiza caudacuta]XP_059343666.1 C-type natriuretic peptide prohormone-like [Ammospiza nelsoni]
MNLKLLFCPGFLLLLIVSQNQAGARSISSSQSESKLLDEDLEHPLVSEEWEHEQDELMAGDVLDQPDTELQWMQSTRDVSMGDAAAIQRFLSHLLSSPRRYQGRRKKGLPKPHRGCFGVRLDRIGSLSGLGC